MSALSKKLIGEAAPKPSELFKQAFPANGKGSTLNWRMHRIIGVAPTQVPSEQYDEWLEQLALANVDSEMPTNHVTADQLVELAKTGNDAMRQFLNEVEQVARQHGANEVAFTDLDGL